MLRHFGFLFAAVLVLCYAQNLSAQPHVSVTAEARDKYRAVLFTFVQDDVPSMNGCHYNLFAADRRAKLQSLPGQGLSIATFFRAEPTVQIIASPLRRLARSVFAKSPKIFFRVLLSCPEGVDGLGEILALRMRSYADGKLHSVSKLAKSMKYHMQYYDP